MHNIFRLTASLFAVALLCSVDAVAQRDDDMQRGPAVVETYSLGSFKLSRSTTGANQQVRGPIPDGVAPRGLSVELGGAGICYDIDTLRVVGAWQGGFLSWRRVHKDRFYDPLGRMLYTSLKQTPGFAKDGRFDDPREHGWGPLPHARFRGYFLHGDQVVLDLSVGKARVLESPAVSKAGDHVAVVRRFTLLGADEALDLLVADGVGEAVDLPGLPAGAAAFKLADQFLIVHAVNAPPATAFRLDDGRLVMHLPKPAADKSLALVTAVLPADAVGTFAALAKVDTPDLRTLTRGGPARWGEPQVTVGRVSEDDDGYVVDTLTVPTPNRWNAPITVGGLDFLADGRAVVCTWDGDVYIVSGIDAKLEALQWQRFATGMFQPLGVKIVDDVIHIVAKDGLYRLHDLNADGEVDWYEVFNNDIAPNLGGHVFNYCLETDTKGNFYYAIGGHRGWVNPQGHHTCIVRVSPDGSKAEVIADSFRETNGLSISPDDVLIAADNPGSPTTTPLDVITPGQSYGYKRDWDKKSPMLYMLHAWDSSAGEQRWVTGDKWGPAKGNLVHTSYGRSALFLVMPDSEQGVVQAAATRFRLRFASGIMRARFHPLDGQLYVGGLRGWDTNAATPGALHRVRYTGKPTLMPVGYTVMHDGIRLTFSAELDAAAADKGNWSAKSIPQARRNQQAGPMTIRHITLEPDGKTLRIQLEDFGIRDCIEFTSNLTPKGGEPTTLKIIATVNSVPEPK